MACQFQNISVSFFILANKIIWKRKEQTFGQWLVLISHCGCALCSATTLSHHSSHCLEFSPLFQEMNEDHSTPKKEKQERLSKHKENMQHSQAEEEAHLLGQQRVFYDRNCRAFKRKVMIKRHEFEQEQIREVRRLYALTDIV